MDQQEIETRLVRTIAHMGALEDMLLAIFDRLSPKTKKEVCRSFLKEGDQVADLMHFEEFTDAELEAYKEARERFYAILVAKPTP
jgi:hypothetical protein